MQGNSRELITSAGRRFPVRIRIAVPPEGLGRQHARMTAWLDENCGADGWAMTPSGTRGVLNDAVSIYFPDVALAGAFVAHWCIGYYKVETAEGAFRVREDEPTPRVRAGLSAEQPGPKSQGIVSLHASEERQWHLQLHLNPNHPLGRGITLLKSDVPRSRNREDICSLPYLPKI